MVSQSRNFFLILTPPASVYPVVKSPKPFPPLTRRTALVRQLTSHLPRLLKLLQALNDEICAYLTGPPTTSEFWRCIATQWNDGDLRQWFSLCKTRQAPYESSDLERISTQVLSVAVHFQPHSSLLSDPIRRRKFVAGLETRRMISLVFSQRD